MALAFAHFFAMWFLAGVASRLVVMKFPDSFVSQALLFAQ